MEMIKNLISNQIKLNDTFIKEIEFKSIKSYQNSIIIIQ